MYSLTSITPAPLGSLLRRVLLPALLVVCSAAVSAAHHKTGHATVWAVDNAASALSFVSVKAGEVAEAHKFGELSGGVVVSPDATQANGGDLNIRIDLSSVNTNIAVRDERMREHLFETEKYPMAVVRGNIAVMDYFSMAVGSSTKTTLKLMLDLHGVKVPFAADVLVSRLSDSRIVVASLKPVVVTAGRFGLVAGVEKLRELAGLPSISGAVPASFVLTFNRMPEAK